MRNSAIHMLALALAEKPLEEHELWLRDQVRTYQAEGSAAAAEGDLEAGLEPLSGSADADALVPAAADAPSPSKARLTLPRSVLVPLQLKYGATGVICVRPHLDANGLTSRSISGLPNYAGYMNRPMMACLDSARAHLTSQAPLMLQSTRYYSCSVSFSKSYIW